MHLHIGDETSAAVAADIKADGNETASRRLETERNQAESRTISFHVFGGSYCWLAPDAAIDIVPLLPAAVWSKKEILNHNETLFMVILKQLIETAELSMKQKIVITTLRV